MADLARRAALFARIGILEGHAHSLREAFRDEWTAEIDEVLRLVRAAKASLEAHGSLADAEHSADAASLLLASIGRALGMHSRPCAQRSHG